METSLWVVYVRVSSETQIQNWNWLQWQETSCREFAKAKWIDVIQIFSDGGVSGKYLSREALDAMILYLKTENKNYTKISYVITDDIDRISRDVVNRWNLKTTIESTWVKLLSLKQNLDDTPEWKLQQNIVMSFKQYERENNARRVRDRQRSRMLNWYRPLYPQQWYKHIKWSDGKKVLSFVEHDIMILKEAFELFASWFFVTKEDFRNYLRKQNFSTRKSKWVTRWFVDRILKESSLLFYAWYIDYKPWDVNMVEAKHEAIIDKSTVYRILDKINPKVLYKKYTYSDIDQKMPLRSVIVCESCWHPLTGWPSRSSTGRDYFYYSCRQQGCESYGKSFNADKVHKKFEDVLANMNIKKSVISLLEKVCLDFYNIKSKEIKQETVNYDKEIKEVNKLIEQLEERILWTNDIKIIALYEKRLREYLDKKNILESSWESIEEKLVFDPIKLFEETKSLLENPYSIWEESDIEDKRLLVKVLFNNKMSYWKISGLWTPEMSHIHRDFTMFWWVNYWDLEMARIELASKRHK